MSAALSQHCGQSLLYPAVERCSLSSIGPLDFNIICRIYRAMQGTVSLLTDKRIVVQGTKTIIVLYVKFNEEIGRECWLSRRIADNRDGRMVGYLYRSGVLRCSGTQAVFQQGRTGTGRVRLAPSEAGSTGLKETPKNNSSTK